MANLFTLATALALLFSAPALPLAGETPKKKVTVDGWSDIKDESLTAARDAAVRDAQKKAVEMTAGVHIQAMMSDESFSKVVNDKERFNQEVVSKIYAKTDGFLGAFRIVKESEDGKTYKATIEVEVNDVELSRQPSLLAKGLAGARFPKLMFVTREEYTGEDGKAVVIDEPTLQSLLENALLSRGFDLVAEDQIKKLRSEESQVFNDILTDENKAAKYAMDYGAEYIVTGVGRVRFSSYDDLHQKEYHGFAELTLRAVNASSAAIVASVKESGNSPANCFSERELRVKAVEHVTPKMIDNLIGRILESWDKETQNGVRYSVKLYNIKSYKNEGLKFIELLEATPNVKQVKKLSYGGERLDLRSFSR